MILGNNTSKLKPKVADSFVTKEKNNSLWIHTSNLIPIQITDLKIKNFADFYPELKGLKKQIILKILKEIGSNKNNSFFTILPYIKGDKYQAKKRYFEKFILKISGKSYKGKVSA